MIGGILFLVLDLLLRQGSHGHRWYEKQASIRMQYCLQNQLLTNDSAAKVLIKSSGLNAAKVNKKHSSSCFSSFQYNVLWLHIPADIAPLESSLHSSGSVQMPIPWGMS